jgi:hypothetical protein
MKYWNKLILSISLAAFFCCVVSPFGGTAHCASTVPVVTPLPAIKDGTITPNRLVQQPGTGYIFVADPHAEGINVYNTVGQLQQKIPVAKEPGGIAFALNGDLLVTQGTYVAVLEMSNGWVENVTKRFGSFKSAFAIAVDNTNTVAPAPLRTATGTIFVSDIQSSYVQYFTVAYAPKNLTGSGHNPLVVAEPPYPSNAIGDSFVNNGSTGGPAIFNRPAGVTFERTSGLLTVVDSLLGRLQFFDLSGNYVTEIGEFGYQFGSNHAAFPFFTYPQSVAYEYTNEVMERVYVLDTFQSYIYVFDGTAGLPSWTWLRDISGYGHNRGYLIVPSDLIFDKKDVKNNRLLVTNGFGSVAVFGISSIQPYNVNINNITSNSMQINWSLPTTTSIKNIRVYRSTSQGVLGTQVGGDLANNATSYTDGPIPPLSQYTTYYYTVRAVDNSSVETTNIDQVSARTTGSFNLQVTVNSLNGGGGTVSGDINSPEISCVSGVCNYPELSDKEVTMTATANAQSEFNGWTGDCFQKTQTCTVTMDGLKYVQATFLRRNAFHVDGAFFDNLQDAYDAAKDGSVIMVLAGTWPSVSPTPTPTEYATAWQSKTVYIVGGYDGTFTNNAGGSTTVTGRTNVFKGKVVMKQLKLRQ